jgi:hypothetical protein
MLHPGTRLLILDLSRVRSCDQAGLAVLIGIQRRASSTASSCAWPAPAPRSRSCCASPAWTAASTCPGLRAALAAEQHEPAKADPALRVLVG